MEPFIESVCERLSLDKLDKNALIQKRLGKTGVRPSHIAFALITFYVFHLFSEHGTKWLSSSIGFFYPAYMTAKLVKIQTDENGEQGRFWLKYWIIYGVLYVTDYLLISILSAIPHYYVIKLFFIVWLFHSDTQGAAVVYDKVVKVAIKKYEEDIDEKLNRLHSFGSESFISDTIQSFVLDTVRTAINV